MPGACDSIRVLELSGGHAGGLAGMVLADFGAEVIRVETSPEGPDWEEPTYLFLNRGKKSVTLDLSGEAGRRELLRLASSVDVVIEMMAPGQAEAVGVGYAAVSAVNPGVVYCGISGFGRTGPLAHLRADDGLIMAKAGQLRAQRGWEAGGERPTFRAGRDASYFAAMLAIQGVLAALRARDITGQGQMVETNMLQAIACRQNPTVRWLLREGEQLPSEAGGASGAEVQSEKHVLPHHMDPRQITLTGARMQCKDGKWVVHSHTEPHFFPAWIDAIGFKWIWEDARFKDAPYKFPTPEDKDELIRLLQVHFKQKDAAEWMAAYVANGNVCGNIVQTSQEALKHPQVVETGLLVELDDPKVGHIVEFGPLANIPGAPAHVRGSAPRPGQDTAAVLGSALTPRPAPVSTGVRLDQPLKGITIVEAAYYYATPFATALLGELGARIIKIEPLRADPYRALGRAGTGDPVLNLGQNNMVRAMSGKESIALNLKDPRGREILHKLVAKADVFIHNFRRGVPETLGMDEATLRAINPKLVYQYGASYGSNGPLNRLPAIDPVITAFTGTTAYQAGAGNEPLTETGADPVAAAGCAAAMMMGIFAQHRTGQGQYVESAMIISNLLHNYEDALAYAGKPARRQPDKRQLGLSATYRLYQTADVTDRSAIAAYANPNPRWVFLSVERDAEFARFCDVAGRGDLAADARFATRKAREQNDTALVGLLEALFLERTAKDWETSMVAAGVGCVVADEMSHFAFIYRDPQALALNYMSPTEHSAFGKYYRYSPMLKFTATPARGTPYSEFGECTRALLTELGYDEDAMAELGKDAVVAWEVEKNQPAKVWG
jgi:crotonobetainyl-CoA:carnitine CoA-transferase CaiB-like acyl-CoA transferase